MFIKKILFVLLVTTMMSSSVYAIESEPETISEAEAASFDPDELFSSLPNYKYDRFDKAWDCYAFVSKKYTDAKFVFGLELFGTDEYVTSFPQIYAYIEDISVKGERKSLYDLTKVQFLINDTIYTYAPVPTTSLNAWMVVSEEDRSVLDALAETDSIVIKVSWADGSLENEFSETDYMPIKTMADTLRNMNVWQYCVDERGFAQYFKANYPNCLTIS